MLVLDQLEPVVCFRLTSDAIRCYYDEASTTIITILQLCPSSAIFTWEIVFDALLDDQEIYGRVTHITGFTSSLTADCVIYSDHFPDPLYITDSIEYEVVQSCSCLTNLRYTLRQYITIWRMLFRRSLPKHLKVLMDEWNIDAVQMR